MSHIEKLTSELCDQLMLHAHAGDLDIVRDTVTSIVEYAAYELARYSEGRFAVSLFMVAEEVGRNFDRATR